MTTILEPAPFPIELTRTRTGLEQLEALRDQRIAMAPMLALMNMRLLEVSKGRVIFSAVPEQRHYSPQGTVHGGLRQCSTLRWARPILVKSRDPCGITLLRNFVGRLRPDDVRLRFAGPRRLESDEEIAGAFQCDCPDSEMIWALAADGALAGIASYALVGTSRLELSLIVRSDLKRRGIGFRLLEEVKARAQQRQISILCGLVLWENLPMRALARKSGFRATGTGGLLAEFELPLRVIGKHTGGPRAKIR
jgi:GNAT superfamily N-acetyltransferase